MLYVTKAVEFSATHRLYNPDFDAARNEKVFGKCNNVNGHGHNYRLEVTVRGDVDPQTGMAFDLSRLKAILEEEVLSRFDHKNLNLDVPAMKGRIPTAENISVALWEILERRLEPGTLHGIRLYETGNNIVEYRGGS
jgi:6-pyruvoyltetrahydropterin/6-carboxytetrahydropterin synthase